MIFPAGSAARIKAREARGVPFPEKLPDEDVGGVPRVAAASSRSDTTPCGICCDHCGLEFELGYRPDPCIGGYLPGVAHACCGHGDAAQAYVTGGNCVPDQHANTIDGHWTIRGMSAIRYIESRRHEASPDP